ncbi:hypothetical protein AN216_24790 [Streptomyces oceani]|uniref:Uncharacterized protein n=1 Tax=Streptomyces oceani TaxID=1075402 RepID=A0A1E7JRN3_9ACTN|nr:hypothetical protein AN216_24790 [Streptomyces oceani]
MPVRVPARAVVVRVAAAVVVPVAVVRVAAASAVVPAVPRAVAVAVAVQDSPAVPVAVAAAVQDSPAVPAGPGAAVAPREPSVVPGDQHVADASRSGSGARSTSRCRRRRSAV